MNAVLAEKPSSPDLLAWLVSRGQLTEAVAERVARLRSESGDRIAGILLKLGLLSEEQLASTQREFGNLSGWDGTAPELPVAADLLSPAFLRGQNILPLAMDGAQLRIACWDASDDTSIAALRFALGRPIASHIGTRSAVLAAIDRLYPEAIAETAVVDRAGSAVEEAEVDRLRDLASDAPVIRLLQELINRAIAAHASDIHLESSESGLSVRLRLDGILKTIANYPPHVAAPLVSRAKVLAGLNIAERRLPQDGRIRIPSQGKDIDFRVATSPVLHGESVVMRILDRQDVALDLDALGYDATVAGALREAIARPYGVILVTGPTGSGKTTTLYAALKEINSPDRKILTAEDPVEYTLEGVNQVPIRPQIGLTFAHALRSFLRQDPDVILVGEIRDKETADIAIQAALTGHLLFSTLHTNTAAAAVPRLLDMGVDHFLLTSTLHLILAQRLVRRLCVHCRQPFLPDAATLSRVGIADPQDHSWYRAVGCSACQGSGYKGRTAIVEVLRMSDEIRALVIAGGDAHALESCAVAGGMRTMFRHGIERVIAGETTLEEVLRVTSLAERPAVEPHP